MNRVAVSILLSSKERPERVLLVHRNPDLKFFGGYLAFPGGTVEEADAKIPVEGNGTAHRGVDFPRFVAAAARELFEETGIWLGRGGRLPNRRALAEKRHLLLAGKEMFSTMLADAGQHIALSDFEPLCRIVTPPFAPRRYDTWFLRCQIEREDEVEIVPGELVEGAFYPASKALAGWRAGELLIVPPVLILLRELAKGVEGFSSRVKAITDSYARGKLHPVTFTPGVLLAPLATPTRPPATHTNTYLVGEERVYVVDPAPVDTGEQERLFELLDGVRDEGRALEAILLTHYHPDHVGALGECQRRYRLPALAHADTARLLTGVDPRHLAHRDELDLGVAPDGRDGWKLRAYHVPGHAPGHLAFQENRYRALLVGDLISTLSSILIDPRDGHLATYLESLRFLETVADGTVYPGHGPPARDGRGAIRAQLRHREQREQQLLHALTEEPQSVDVLAAQVYTDIDPALMELARRSLLSGLRKLEEEGRVVPGEEGWSLKL